MEQRARFMSDDEMFKLVYLYIMFVLVSFIINDINVTLFLKIIWSKMKFPTL